MVLGRLRVGGRAALLSWDAPQWTLHLLVWPSKWVWGTRTTSWLFKGTLLGLGPLFLLHRSRGQRLVVDGGNPGRWI